MQAAILNQEIVAARLRFASRRDARSTHFVCSGSPLCGAPTHEQQELERTMVHMAMIEKQNDAIIGLLNEVVERIEGPDPDDGE